MGSCVSCCEEDSRIISPRSDGSVRPITRTPPCSPIDSEYGVIEPNPPPWSQPPTDRIGDLLV